MNAADPARPRRRWLTRSVWGFGLASLLSDAGHEAATASLPILLATLGAAPFALGLIEGVSDGISSFVKLFGGWVADRPHRRKPIAVAGYAVTGLAMGAYAFAGSWMHILLARTVAWIAKGSRAPARDAMLAEAVPPESRGRAFGFHRAMDSAGAAVGPLLASVLLVALPLRQVFLWTVVPGVLSALVFWLLVSPSPRSHAAPPAGFMVSLRGLPPRYRTFLLAIFVFGVGDFGRTLLILRATQALAPQVGVTHAAAAAALLYMGHNAVYALLSYPVGWLSDRWGAERLLVVGYTLGTLTGAMAAVDGGGIAWWIVAFGVGGATLAFEDTLEPIVAVAESPAAVRGTALGALAATNGVGDLVSSTAVGVLWTVFGPEVAFGSAAVVCAFGTVGMANLARRSPRPVRQP